MEDKDNEGLDAVNTLLIMGYKIIKQGDDQESETYILCGKSALITDEDSRKITANLLLEIEQNKEHYTKRIIELGRRMFG